MKKRFFFAAMMLLATTGAFAQGNGIGGITETTNMGTSFFGPGNQQIYSIGGVVGPFRGVEVYFKFFSGGSDTPKTAARWVGGRIFFIGIATNLRSFFL